MRAIRFDTFGDPSVLELAEAPTPAADASDGGGAGHGGLDQSE